MAGKWAKLLKTMPRSYGLEPTYQQKVDVVKNVILEDTPRHGSALAARYAVARKVKARVEEDEAEVNLEIEALRQLIVDQYEAEGVASIKLEDGESVWVQHEPYAQVVDRDAHRKWAVDNGLERQLALPWPTTNALTKAALEAGQPEPAGVQTFSRPKLILRKA